jgi:hypothetical protein
MMRLGLIVLVLLTAAWIPMAAVAQTEAEAVDLRPQWTPGQAATYTFSNVRTSESQVRFPDQTVEADFTIRSEGEVRWEVQRVNDDGSARGLMTLKWMTVEVTTPDGQTLKNDTRKATGDEPTMHALGKAMAGKPLTIHVAADGTVTKAEGIKAMRDDVDDPELVPDERDFIETATDLASLSGVPAAMVVGDDWSLEQTWNFGIIGMNIGSLDQDWEYTLQGVETIEGVPVAVIRGKCDRMRMDDSAVKDEMPPEAPPIRLRLTDAEATQQILFDLTRREAVGRFSTMATRVEMSIPLPNGQRIERTVSETIEGSTLRIAEQ